jgi:hypothetical protein
MFESSVMNYLSSYTGLTALVSSRITPVVLPTPATYPSVTFQTIAAEDDLVMGQEAGIFECRVQFDCWGSSYGSTKAVAIQVKNAFRNYTGDMKGTVIHCTKLVNEMDAFNSTVFRTTLEFEFQYQE